MGDNSEFTLKSPQNVSKQNRKPFTTRGWIILGTCGVIGGAIYAIATPFVIPALRKYCLPYVPATTKQVANVICILKDRSGSLVDLGSGDGRIVIEAAKHKFTSCGIELNYWLVLYSRWSAWRQGFWYSTKFAHQDLWKTDLSLYNNIVIFGVDTMMEQLREKLTNEMDNRAVVVACRFPVPNRMPIRSIDDGIDSVWLYDRTALSAYVTEVNKS